MVKKPKDPNAPKRPLSAYFMWMDSGVRRQLLSQGMKLSKVISTCGTRWSQMPEEEKKVWQDKAKPAREAYEKAMAKYKETDGYKQFLVLKKEHKLKKVKTAKKPKDKNRPKRPLSAYFLYSQDFKKTCPATMKFTEVSKKSGEKWKVLDAATKKKYEEAAAVEKAKYEKVLAKYMKSNEYLQYQEELDAFKVKKKMNLKKLSKGKTKGKRKTD